MKYVYKTLPSALINCCTIALLISLITACNKENFTTSASSILDVASAKNGNKINATSAAKQTARAGVMVSTHIHGFYEYLPRGYANDSTSHPLLICMHGIGQVGNGTTDLPGLLTYGPAMLINDSTFPATFTVDGRTFSMIVITPQLTDVGMFPVDIDSLIEYCKSHYRIDTNRVYLTGVSIGGAEIWHYAGYSEATANKIAAIVPIAAWTTPQNNYQVSQEEAQTVAAANIAIWQTHCYNDPTASFSWSVSQADMVSNSFPPPIPLPKLTCFNSNSHDAWTTTYDPSYKESGMNIYQWMLHYSKDSVSTPIPKKIPLTQVVTLEGSNNLYAHNDNNGSPLLCSSETYTQWEGFVVVGVSGNKVALQNQGHYVSKVNPASVACTATSITPNETFTWIFNVDGSVSFESNNGKYLSDNNGALNCKATFIGINERFLINH